MIESTRNSSLVIPMVVSSKEFEDYLNDPPAITSVEGELGLLLSEFEASEALDLGDDSSSVEIGVDPYLLSLRSGGIEGDVDMHPADAEDVIYEHDEDGEDEMDVDERSSDEGNKEGSGDVSESNGDIDSPPITLPAILQEWNGELWPWSFLSLSDMPQIILQPRLTMLWPRRKRRVEGRFSRWSYAWQPSRNSKRRSAYAHPVLQIFSSRPNPRSPLWQTSTALL